MTMLLTSLFCFGMVSAGSQKTFNSGNRTRQTSGFFTSIGYDQWPGVRLIKYRLVREYARRLLTVLSPRPPSQKGRTLKCQQEPIMAMTSHNGYAVARSAAHDAEKSLKGLLSLLEDRGDFTANGEQLALLLLPILRDLTTLRDELECGL